MKWRLSSSNLFPISVMLDVLKEELLAHTVGIMDLKLELVRLGKQTNLVNQINTPQLAHHTFFFFLQPHFTL